MSDSDNHGSFLNGFTMGLFAGAAGYFLFGTNKGSDLRKKMSQEWEKAKGELAKKGVIEEGQGIRELVTSTVNKMSQSSGPKTQTKSKSSKQNTKAKPKKKFKGV